MAYGPQNSVGVRRGAWLLLPALDLPGKHGDEGTPGWKSLLQARLLKGLQSVLPVSRLQEMHIQTRYRLSTQLNLNNQPWNKRLDLFAVPLKQQVPLCRLWQQTLALILPHPLLLAELGGGVMVGLLTAWAVVHKFGISVLKQDTNAECPRWWRFYVPAEL